MLLKITHHTNLNYSAAVHETVMELRMLPRQEQDQHRLSFTLAVGPGAPVTWYFDWLGNAVHTFSVNPFHRQVRIEATSVVEVDRNPPELSGVPDRWPIETTPDHTCWDYMQFGGAVVRCAALERLVDELKPRKGMGVGSLIWRMLQAVEDRFEYRQGVTSAASPITEILQHRRGVCQDFTHLMIGMARLLGIPARYVSGYLHQGKNRYRGSAQTHAWCELLLPSLGWIGIDPTNNCVVNSNFVKLAVGRDYRDVPPHKGLFKGKAQESMEVSVSSEELPSVPASLPAERVQPINVPVFSSSRESVSAESQQVQQQQQQKRAGEDDHQQQQQQQQQKRAGEDDHQQQQQQQQQ